jgi:hypothetical protein
MRVILWFLICFFGSCSNNDSVGSKITIEVDKPHLNGCNPFLYSYIRIDDYKSDSLLVLYDSNKYFFIAREENANGQPLFCLNSYLYHDNKSERMHPNMTMKGCTKLIQKRFFDDSMKIFINNTLISYSKFKFSDSFNVVFK